MRAWLVVPACLLGGCMPYDLVQPEPEPTRVSISVSADHDSSTLTWASISIEPGIDETGDFRRVPVEPVVVDGPFDKRQLDPAYVRERERLITRGWKRLQEVAGLGIPIIEYPLPEVIARIKARSVGLS